MKRAGQNWGSGRPKHNQAAVAKAMRLRAGGMKLEQIAKETGLSPSYISRLGRFLEQGKGRSGLSGKAGLEMLQARKKKLQKRLNEVNRQIKGLKNGQSGDCPQSHVGPDEAAGAPAPDRRPLRVLRAPTPGSAGTASGSPGGETVDSGEVESGGQD